MQHAGHAKILHVGERAGHLGRDIKARHRLADDLEVLGVFGRHGLFGIELDGEPLSPDQLWVGKALAATADGAVGGLEVFLIDGELPGGLVKERVLGCCACLANLHAADLDGDAAPGLALVGRQQSVALHEVNPA